MPSLSDSVVLFILALILLGPKKLPQLARQLGKLMAEFRKASNEFRMQMEDELRIEEQKEHQRKVEALAGPTSTTVDPAIPTSDPPHPHLPQTAVNEDAVQPVAEHSAQADDAAGENAAAQPIARSGELTMMPPSTGLPTGRGRNGYHAAEETVPEANPVSGFGISTEEPLAEAHPHLPTLDGDAGHHRDSEATTHA